MGLVGEVTGGGDDVSKSEIPIEIITLERELGVTPHGSRHVGGFTEESDYDYFFDATAIGIKWLQDNGYERQFATGYWDGAEETPDAPNDNVSLVAYRHPKLPIQVLALSHDYYPIYFDANEKVKSMQGAVILETRDGRITTYKHFIAKAREQTKEVAPNA